MKTLVTIIILAASLLSASAQKSTTYKISDFHSINISTVANVIISQGDYSVKAKHKLPEGEELKVEKRITPLWLKQVIIIKSRRKMVKGILTYS